MDAGGNGKGPGAWVSTYQLEMWPRLPAPLGNRTALCPALPGSTAAAAAAKSLQSCPICAAP